MAAAEVIIGLCRAGIFASVLMLWGAALFRIRLDPTASRKHEGWWIAMLGTAVLLLLPAQVALFADNWKEVLNPGSLSAVIGMTSPGRSWLMLAGFTVFLSTAWAHDNDNGIMLSGLGLMTGLSMTGHAAASEGLMGLLRQANDILHMVAAAAWLGALPHLLGLLPGLQEAKTRQILIRYSGEGHVWVSLVLVTGMISTLWILKGIPLDVSSRYAQLWWLKVLIVMTMVGLAVRNRYLLVPRLKTAPAARHAIANATRAEIILGLAALGLVACFGMLEP